MNIEIELEGYKIEVLDGPYLIDGHATEAALAFAKKLVSELSSFKKAAADQLLNLYHDTWLDDEIGPLTKEQFIEHLTDPKITIYDEEGAACIYFSDSNMFAGHLIQISINQGNLSAIDIVG